MTALESRTKQNTANFSPQLLPSGKFDRICTTKPAADKERSRVKIGEVPHVYQFF
jgi:hypothetical protein